MKKIILAISVALVMTNIKAQNYQISFAGTGASNTVDSVKVLNETQCTNKSVGGGDILHLTASSGINDNYVNSDDKLLIYPNPVIDNSIIEFVSPINGNVSIGIYNIMGKKIIQIQNNLLQGRHYYKISGINSGVYTIKINSEKYSYTGKLISNCNAKGAAEIIYQNQNTTFHLPCIKKDISSGIDMQYNTGDILKITGISGLYRTVVMLKPTQSQTVTFNFMACTDGDSNNYSVVQIGSQIWMAENLKTTKYSNSNTIPNVIDTTAWSSLNTGAYCNYNNTNNNDTINTLGSLYNWYAVITGNLCPAGWHVPTAGEWESMDTYLNYSGRKLEEKCTTFWNNPINDATNETGFTGLPGGIRQGNGAFLMIGYNGTWWSSTPESSTVATGRCLEYFYSDLCTAHFDKKTGCSVRCLKD